MKTPFSFASAETKAALVLVFPPTVKGFFNSEALLSVCEVQDLLDEVYVIYALSSGTSHNLRDSIDATRFRGCESTVVAPVGAGDAARFIDTAPKGDWMFTASHVDAEYDASTLVDAYLAAVTEVGRAA